MADFDEIFKPTLARNTAPSRSTYLKQQAVDQGLDVGPGGSFTSDFYKRITQSDFGDESGSEQLFLDQASSGYADSFGGAQMPGGRGSFSDAVNNQQTQTAPQLATAYDGNAPLVPIGSQDRQPGWFKGNKNTIDSGAALANGTSTMPRGVSLGQTTNSAQNWTENGTMLTNGGVDHFSPEAQRARFFANRNARMAARSHDPAVRDLGLQYSRVQSGSIPSPMDTSASAEAERKRLGIDESARNYRDRSRGPAIGNMDQAF